MKTVVLQPRLSEKTYGLSSTKNQVYVFDIAKSLNKHSVAKAVETQFGVSVKSVNILNQKGKAKRTIAKQGRKVYSGHEADSKKAYVTLKAGDSLPFFEAIEEEEAKSEATQAKMEKAMEKQEAKESKVEAKTKPKAKPAAKPTEKPVEEKLAEKPRRRLHLRGRRGSQEDKE